MKTYGQYCPLAKAAEIISPRWSILLLRDLLGGINRFSELQKGVPLMSPSLLSRRLKEFESCGLIERVPVNGSYRYHATEAAKELRPVLYLLAVWGQRWVRNKLSEDELDASLLMWDMSLRIDPKKFGPKRTVIAFEYTDGAALNYKHWKNDKWWLLIEAGECELCLRDPGFEIDLYVLCDLRSMTSIWMGDLSIRAAQDSGQLELHGSKKLKDSMQDWFALSVHAGHNRPPVSMDLDEFLKNSGLMAE